MKLEILYGFRTLEPPSSDKVKPRAFVSHEIAKLASVKKAYPPTWRMFLEGVSFSEEIFYEPGIAKRMKIRDFPK